MAQNLEGGFILMRKVGTTIFLAIILSSTVLLGVSTFYAVDTYRAFGFTVEITEIRVYYNETSGEYTRVQVDIRIFNPSLTLELEYLWSDTYTVLNGQPIEYGWGEKYHHTWIPPGDFDETGWSHDLVEEDQALFQAAEASGTWMWFEFLQPYLSSGFLGRNQVSRPITYEGVVLISI